MTYEKLARTLDQVLADNVRLKRERDEAVAALSSVLKYHTFAINGSRGGAYGVAEVEYTFRKAELVCNALLARLT